MLSIIVKTPLVSCGIELVVHLHRRLLYLHHGLRILHSRNHHDITGSLGHRHIPVKAYLEPPVQTRSTLTALELASYHKGCLHSCNIESLNPEQRDPVLIEFTFGICIFEKPVRKFLRYLYGHDSGHCALVRGRRCRDLSLRFQLLIDTARPEHRCEGDRQYDPICFHHICSNYSVTDVDDALLVIVNGN